MDTQQIQATLTGKSIHQALLHLTRLFPGQVSFSSSLSLEDQVLTDIIFRNEIPVTVFTLDTGRLFNEVYELIQVTEAKYGQRIQSYFPESSDVETLVSDYGINCFYQSTELRKRCCHVRKVIPLQRALEGVKIWVTGLRAAQSENRHSLQSMEWDHTHQLIKYNPLVDWTIDEISDYIEKNAVPVNPMYKKGFASIGCAPCTRAIFPGEDVRAGRWWWEASKKECGLHEQAINFQI
jgi:phosphoadenosine phosphosulfate reductase